MISCPRCGQTTRADAATCPNCGTPLVSPALSGVTESGMPIWLKQLQAQQQMGPSGPAGPAMQYAQGGQPGMQPGGLISEDALPAWLHSESQSGPTPPSGQRGWGAAQGANAGAGGYGAAFGAGGANQFGPPPPNGQAPQAGGLAGLIDESALPEWLRQGASGQGMNGQGQPAYAPTYPSPNGQGMAPAGYAPGRGAPGSMAAGSLIDEQALPAWMHQPNAAGRPAPPVSGSAMRREGMDASSLVDDGALPQWLRAAQPDAGGQDGQWAAGAAPAQGQLPPWLVQAQQAGAQAGAQAQALPPQPPVSPQAMPPSDDSALPEWLRGQGMAGRPPSAPVNPASMPAWVRSDPAGATSGAWGSGVVAPQGPRQPPNSEWLTDVRVPAAPTSRAGASGVPDAELPPWLRNAQRTVNPGGPSGSVAPRGGYQPGNGQGTPANGQLPPWLRRGPQGPAAPQPGQPGRSSNRQPSPQGYSPADPRGFSQSRAGDPRGGYYAGEAEGAWDEDEEYPPDDEQDWDRGSRQRGRRGGLFGFLRRR